MPQNARRAEPPCASRPAQDAVPNDPGHGVLEAGRALRLMSLDHVILNNCNLESFSASHKPEGLSSSFGSGLTILFSLERQSAGLSLTCLSEPQFTPEQVEGVELAGG